MLIVIGAAAYYLRSVPTAGNDILLDVTLAAAGATLGGLCALATRLRRGADGVPLTRAGWVAAILALAEVVTRLAVLWLRSSRLPDAAPSAARATVPA